MAKLLQQFYNLNADPFRLCPDHHFSFPHRTYKKGFDNLKLGLASENGFIVITGRPGTGKTTLINETIAQLDPDKVVAATLLTTRYEARDLLSMIASSFSLKCDKKPKSVVLLELKTFLRMRHSEGKRALLIIDEAQGLTADAVEELQLLSDSQIDDKPLLQIILIGQEELRDIIDSPKLEHLRKHVITSSRLEPLSEYETIDYIAYRLDHAGWTGDPAITRGAGSQIYQFSGGIPRIINRICNRLLLHGCSKEKHELNADDMKSVLEKLSEELLLNDNNVVLSDIDEKVNTLENKYIQPLSRIKKTSIETAGAHTEGAVIQLDSKRQHRMDVVYRSDDLLSRQDGNAAIRTSGPTEYTEFFNNPESTFDTDESTDNISVENNTCDDPGYSNDESQAHLGTTEFYSPTRQAPDTRERSRWPGTHVWLAVPVAIAIAAGLKFYPGVSQDPAQTQSKADFDSRSPAHQTQLAENKPVDIVPADDASMRVDIVKNETVSIRKSLDVPADNGNDPGNNHDEAEKPLEHLETGLERVKEAVQSSHEAANMRYMNPPADTLAMADMAGSTATVKAANTVESKQAKIHEIASGITPALTVIAPGLTPVETAKKPFPDKAVPSGNAKPAGQPGEKQLDAEENTATGPVPQPLKSTTAPDINAEPVEPMQVAVSGESVQPGNAEPAAIQRSGAATVKQTSKPSVQLPPEVTRTTETLTLAKTEPVIIKSGGSSRPVEKELQKARITGNVTEAADPANPTMDNLLARQWATDTRQPAPHLPSFITNCSSTPGKIECWSREHYIENNGESVRVKTKSHLRDFTESGFTIRYKHMLLGDANDKRRWDSKTHQLDCMIINSNKIKCGEDGDNSAVIFTQITSDQLVDHFTHTSLTSSKWQVNNQPATILPSYITSCQLEDDRLSCWSKPRKHSSGDNTETIKTKALIGQIIDGDFIVKYRNMVILESGPSGWKNDTREARCSIQDFNNIVCMEDNKQLNYTKDIQEF